MSKIRRHLRRKEAHLVEVGVDGGIGAAGDQESAAHIRRSVVIEGENDVVPCSHSGLTDHSYSLPGKLVSVVWKPELDLVAEEGELSGELERKVLTSSQLRGGEPVSPETLEISGTDAYFARTHSMTLSTSSSVIVRADGSQRPCWAKRVAFGKSPALR